MSEQDSTILNTEDEDVEAHAKKIKAADKAASEDDVELQGRRNVLASDEPRDETEGDDDVELHGNRGRKAM